MFSIFNNGSWLSQKQRVLQILQSKKECTPMDFVNRHIFRYSAHIHELRKQWHNIKTIEIIEREDKTKKIKKIIVTYKLS